MSEVLLIAMADKAPVSPTPDQNTTFHENLLSMLNTEAKRQGWNGSELSVYVRMAAGETPYVSMTIAPASDFASIEDLRAFRARERMQRELQDETLEQGRLC